MKKINKLRCYAKQVDGLWVAVCIDLSLAAQDECPSTAIQKLHEQIKEYIYDITEGKDVEYFYTLLCRYAPIRQRIEYYWIKFVVWLKGSKSVRSYKIFKF